MLRSQTNGDDAERSNLIAPIPECQQFAYALCVKYVPNRLLTKIQFQYTALCNYAVEVRKHWKGALRKQAAMETAYTKERKQRRQLQSELKELQQRANVLEQGEAELKNWERRKPMINRRSLHPSTEMNSLIMVPIDYLEVFPNMARYLSLTHYVLVHR